ncbi:MAG: formyltransferase family protein, partial [Betaproteobacteria bacterium]
RWLKMLKNIIVLSSNFIAQQVVDLLKGMDDRLSYFIVEDLKGLERYDSHVLSETRLISLLSTTIVPKNILDSLGYGGINFHPGPPSYPGWAPYNFALYDEVSVYGTTAHYMEEKVDAGKIVGVKYFPIKKDTDFDHLFVASTESLSQLIRELASQLIAEKDLPALPIQWGGIKFTKKLFKQYCVINEDISEKELSKRIKAFSHGLEKSKLFINSDVGKFEIDSGKTYTVNKEYKTIHRVKFSKS